MNTILLATTITVILCSLAIAGHGQTFSEWFRQKKTRTKYLRQQVAALETFRAAIRGGYEETEEKVEEAEDEEKGSAEMDEHYLKSLDLVKDFLKKDINHEKATLSYDPGSGAIDHAQSGPEYRRPHPAAIAGREKTREPKVHP